MAIHYEKYWLSRIISVQAIVSADYIKGCHPAATRHIHQDAWELILCRRGNVMLHHNQDTLQLSQGQLILIQPGITHDLEITDPSAKTFVLSFVCSNDNYLFSLQNTILQATDAMFVLAASMIRELKDTFGPQEERLHLFHFIPDANSPLGAEQMICCYLHKAFQTYLADQVTAYIQENLSGPLSVSNIAEHFHYSRARLSALYKEATGVGISEAIANAKIQAAKRMLRGGEKSIAQISEELGFSSPQYFSYKFAKITGQSPSQYCKGRK